MMLSDTPKQVCRLASRFFSPASNFFLPIKFVLTPVLLLLPWGSMHLSFFVLIPWSCSPFKMQWMVAHSLFSPQSDKATIYVNIVLFLYIAVLIVIQTYQKYQLLPNF